MVATLDNVHLAPAAIANPNHMRNILTVNNVFAQIARHNYRSLLPRDTTHPLPNDKRARGVAMAS
jgi:hypothetical protein